MRISNPLNLRFQVTERVRILEVLSERDRRAMQTRQRVVENWFQAIAPPLIPLGSRPEKEQDKKRDKGHCPGHRKSKVERTRAIDEAAVIFLGG